MAGVENLVSESSTTTGTGNFTLATKPGFQTFNDAFGTGGTDVFFYFISNQGATEWEVGTGHMSDSTTLVRDSVIDSSNGGSVVSFSAGTKDVSCDVPASQQYRLGGTDVSIADGGTGASDAATAFSNLKQAASDTATGVLEIADTTEMEAGSATDKAVVPGRQHRHPSAAKAWAYVTALSTTPVVSAGYGVTSVTRNSAGSYTVNFATSFSSANYAMSIEAQDTTLPYVIQIYSKTASSATILCANLAGVLADCNSMHAIAFGDQ